jgi:hypothetical protein
LCLTPLSTIFQLYHGDIYYTADHKYTQTKYIFWTFSIHIICMWFIISINSVDEIYTQLSRVLIWIIDSLIYSVIKQRLFLFFFSSLCSATNFTLKTWSSNKNYLLWKKCDKKVWYIYILRMCIAKKNNLIAFLFVDRLIIYCQVSMMQYFQQRWSREQVLKNVGNRWLRDESLCIDVLIATRKMWYNENRECFITGPIDLS